MSFVALGIHSIGEDQYRGDPCPEPSLSASLIGTLIDYSPAHAKAQHPRLTAQPVGEESAIMDIGSIAHALLLEGLNKAVIMEGVVDKKTGETGFFADYRTKAAQEARDVARAQGLYPVLKDRWDDVEGMVVAARTQLDAHKEASSMFTNGKPEQSLVWFDKEFNVWGRGRADWLHDNHRFIDDYKTTSASANPETVSRTLFTHGWELKAAWYLRGLKMLTGVDAQFRFAVQETTRPYALSVIGLGPDVMMIAEKKIRWAMETWRKCLDTGVWPAYPERVCYASLPEWMENAWLRRELAEVSA